LRRSLGIGLRVGLTVGICHGRGDLLFAFT